MSLPKRYFRKNLKQSCQDNQRLPLGQDFKITADEFYEDGDDENTCHDNGDNDNDDNDNDENDDNDDNDENYDNGDDDVEDDDELSPAGQRHPKGP